MALALTGPRAAARSTVALSASTAGTAPNKLQPLLHRNEAMPTDEAGNAAEKTGQIGDATMISRSPSVVTAEVDGEIVMMSIEQGRYFGLDDIGSDIWKRIEPPCSFAALIDGLVADYEADRATIAADVQTLLDRMVEQNVVRLS
jgi:Coenzyme PQQ synthesis protein D (PqqD)